MLQFFMYSHNPRNRNFVESNEIYFILGRMKISKELSKAIVHS